MKYAILFAMLLLVGCQPVVVHERPAPAAPQPQTVVVTPQPAYPVYVWPYRPCYPAPVIYIHPHHGEPCPR
jgi:hypothetical protein